jgi:hypothetical protein
VNAALMAAWMIIRDLRLAKSILSTGARNPRHFARGQQIWSPLTADERPPHGLRPIHTPKERHQERQEDEEVPEEGDRELNQTRVASSRDIQCWAQP